MSLAPLKKSQNGPGTNPTEAAFHSLLRAFGLLRQVMEPYFARFGISASQWAILRVLQRAESGGEAALRLTDLSERLLIQPPSVTGVVDRLERQGLVKRSGFKADLRVRQASLTAAGRSLVNQVLEGHPAQIRSLFVGLSPQELQRLSGMLKRFEMNLETLAQHPAEGASSRRKAILPSRSMNSMAKA